MATAYALNQTGEYGTAANWTPNGIPDASTGDTITDLGGFTLQIEADHDVISIVDSTGGSTIDMSYGAGTYTLEVIGDCNIPNVTLTQGNGKLKLSGTGATCTVSSSSDEFWDVEITGTVSAVTTGTYVFRINNSFVNSGTLTIQSGKFLDIQNCSVDNSGTVTGGNFRFRLDTANSSYTGGGNLNSVITVFNFTTATADRTLTFNSACNTGNSSAGPLVIFSADSTSTYKCIVDFNIYDTEWSKIQVQNDYLDSQLLMGTGACKLRSFSGVHINNTSASVDAEISQVVCINTGTITDANTAYYNLNIGDGSTTTSVTAASNLIVDGFTVTNAATWSFSTFTVTVPSFWYAGTTAIVNYNTGTVNLTGTGARVHEFRIDGSTAKEYYIIDIDDDYSIAGDIETVIIDGTQNGLQIASGKTVTLEKHIELMDRQIQNMLCNGSTVVTGVGLGEFRMILELTTSQSMNSAQKPTLSACNTVFKLDSGYTGGVDGRITFSGASTFDSVEIDSDHATYDCEVETITVAFVCNGICTVGAKGILLNDTTDADWTFNENWNISGTVILNISAMAGSQHVSMAAGKSINALSGSTVLFTGTIGTDVVISWAAAGINFMNLTGGTITIDYLQTVTNVSGVLINGNCTLDADDWDITGTVGGLGITSDFTLTKMSDCILTSAAINSLYIGSSVTGDYDFTNITFAGAHTYEIEHDGIGFLQFFDAVGLGVITDGVKIDNATGGVVNDEDITGTTVTCWGKLSLSDCTNVGSWANDILLAVWLNENTSYPSNVTWDVDLEVNRIGTATNSTLTIVDGAYVKYRQAGASPAAVANVGAFVFDLGAAETAYVQATAGDGIWGTNPPTFSATCKGTVYLGTAALEGMDLATNNLHFLINGLGVVVELVGTNNLHTVAVGGQDTLQSPTNGGANTQFSNAISIYGVMSYGVGTITGIHTWTMENGTDITVQSGGTSNITGNGSFDVNLVWTTGNGGIVDCIGTIVWAYADVDYIDYIELTATGDITIDNSNLLADGAGSYGIYGTAAGTITSMDTTIISGGDYAIYWLANNVDCTGAIQNCQLSGTIADIYLDSVDGILELIDCDDDGANGRLEVIVPRGGISDDGYTMDNWVRFYGTLSTSDLSNFSNWTTGDVIAIAQSAGGQNGNITMDADCSIYQLVHNSLQTVNVSGTINTGNTRTTTVDGTFNCLDGMVYGPTSGVHYWNGATPPNIGYDSANSPTIQFRNMDFATNSIPISTTNAGVLLVTTGNIAWYILIVKANDEWQHTHAGTTITWTAGQTSTIETGGFARVFGTSGSRITWTTTGADHLIIMDGSNLFKFLEVDHSDASGGKTIYSVDSINNLNNTNWWFSGDTQWQGMAPEIFKVGATELTPTIIGDIVFNLSLNIYEHQTLRSNKPTVDQNWVEIRGRSNIRFGITCIDLNVSQTDLDQFEEWFRNGTIVTVLDRYTSVELTFKSYSPAGWRIVNIGRERRTNTDTVYYSVSFEEVPV